MLLQLVWRLCFIVIFEVGTEFLKTEEVFGVCIKLFLAMFFGVVTKFKYFYKKL